MAKKPPKSARQKRKETSFFEAMPQAMAGFPIIAPPLEQPTDQPVLPAGPAASQAKEALQGLGHDAQAVLADSWYYLRRINRTIWSRPARLLYLTLFIGGIVVGSFEAVTFVDKTTALYASALADPSALLTQKNTGTTILDRNGQVLYQVYGATTRVMIAEPNVPKNLENATLAAEDPEFYQHNGVSWRGMARALYQDVIHHGAVEGGSTLTQQLVKNTLLTPNRSIIRKAQEITLATEMEQRYSKQKIMELYLNGVYYGQGSYGVGTAAQTYFKKDIKDLTLGESAMLAGLPLGPSRFDPTLDPAVAKQRRDFVLDRMQSLNMITPEQATAAKAEPINASARQVQIQAPHFVFYVLDQLRAQYGDDKVEHGGLTVYTTLDLTKQTAAQNIVTAQISRLGSRHVTDGAMVSLDPKTGEILAMVGSSDYNNPAFGAVNVTTAQRQPGSSIKPLIYLDSFTKGWSPATIVDDSPVSFPDGSTTYTPRDYDLKWRGKLTLRRALANSFNVPAIHVLQYVTIPDALNFMHKLGITTLNDPSRYGLSLVLGGGEVKMVDMAAAYGVFANNGVSVSPVAIQKVLDRNGQNITIKPAKSPQQLVDPRDVAMLTSILSDNNARKEEFGTNTPLQLSRPAAVKTGTTTDFKDNWTIGYTPDVVTVAWAGNADDTPMGNGVDGVTGAAPIWHDYMELVLAGTPVHNFVQPAGMTTVTVCTLDGNLANPWDTATQVESFPTEMVPKNHCGSAPPAPTPPPDQPTAPVVIQPVPPTPAPVPPIQCKPFKKCTGQ